MPRTGENIYKRKDGRWEGRYLKKTAASKSSYGYVYGKSYRDVKSRLSKAKAEWELQQSAIAEKTDDTLSHVAAAWLEDSRGFFKESTYVKYRNLLNSYILPPLGNCFISKITNEKIYELSCSLLKSGGRKAAGLSPKTVSDILSLLKSIQKYAFNKNMAASHISCSLPVKQPLKQLRVFTVPEQRTLTGYLKKDLTLSNLGVLLCLFTGIRIGELCALKWEDISLRDRTISIHQTMQRLPQDGGELPQDNGGTEKTARTKILISAPKSDCSVRVIPLPDIIMEELAQMRQASNSYFLTGDPKKYTEPRTMQNRFKAILKTCGIHDANFHTLRHTFATRCIEAGFDTKSLSEILGHANVNITLNRYVHPTMEQKQKNMSRLSELFSVR